MDAGRNIVLKVGDQLELGRGMGTNLFLGPDRVPIIPGTWFEMRVVCEKPRTVRWDDSRRVVDMEGKPIPMDDRMGIPDGTPFIVIDDPTVPAQPEVACNQAAA